jgi:hypothetical protein
MKIGKREIALREMREAQTKTGKKRRSGKEARYPRLVASEAETNKRFTLRPYIQII